jgi:hypothetical protein
MCLRRETSVEPLAMVADWGIANRGALAAHTKWDAGMSELTTLRTG